MPKSSRCTSPVGAHQDVRGFEVAMDDEPGVRVGHRPRHLEEELQARAHGRGARASQYIVDTPGLSTYSSARYGRPSGVYAGVVDARDVGMRRGPRECRARAAAVRRAPRAASAPRGSFSATCRRIVPSLRSASQTDPMPPLPISRSSRYGPIGVEAATSRVSRSTGGSVSRKRPSASECACASNATRPGLTASCSGPSEESQLVRSSGVKSSASSSSRLMWLQTLTSMAVPSGEILPQRPRGHVRFDEASA